MTTPAPETDAQSARSNNSSQAETSAQPEAATFPGFEAHAEAAAGRCAGSSSLGDVEAQFSELLAYVAYYLAAERDLAKWRLRAVVWRVVLLLGAGLAAVSVVVTAAVFVVHGSAQGLGVLLGDRPWAGELIVGLGVFLTLAVSRSLAFSRVRRRWREKIMAKYETYRQRQRAVFGHDVERAAQPRGDRSA